MDEEYDWEVISVSLFHVIFHWLETAKTILKWRGKRLCARGPVWMRSDLCLLISRNLSSARDRKEYVERWGSERISALIIGRLPRSLHWKREDGCSSSILFCCSIAFEWWRTVGAKGRKKSADEGLVSNDNLRVERGITDIIANFLTEKVSVQKSERTLQERFALFTLDCEVFPLFYWIRSVEKRKWRAIL